MKKVIISVLILSLIVNMVQCSLIIRKNKAITSLTYTEKQVLDIMQLLSEIERDICNYEFDMNVGNDYYQAIANMSSILTYMQYNFQYEDAREPMFQLNLALHHLFGYMHSEQGKAQLLAHSSQIRGFLHEIVTAHREGRINDRDQAISDLQQYSLKD